MDIEQNFLKIEENFNLKFSPIFFDFIKFFFELTKKVEFKKLFNECHIVSIKEMEFLLNYHTPEEYIPFFVDDQESFSDYYCFLKKDIENKKQIVVFSNDGIVFDWDTSYDFMVWIKNKF